METEVIKLLINSYFNIVKREMIDMVPKAITLTLVNFSKENLQRELLQELYKPEVLDELLKESEFVVNRRKEVVGMVQALNKAEEYVLFDLDPGRVPDITRLQDRFGCLRCWRGVLAWSSEYPNTLYCAYYSLFRFSCACCCRDFEIEGQPGAGNVSI